MAKEGLIFVLPSLVLALAFFALRLPLPACVFLVLTLLFLFFFRDPSRVPPPLNKGEILSPADGRVLEIVSTHPTDQEYARQRMQQYKQAGLKPAFHKLG